MAKTQKNDDSLFGNINLDGFENDLLVVDNLSENGDLKDEIAEVTKPKPGNEQEKNQEQKKPKPEELITVDTGDEPVTDDDIEEKVNEQNKSKNKESGGASKNTEENDSPVYLHAAALQENGVLPNFDLKELKDLDPAAGILKINEHIQKQIDESIKEGVDEFKSQIGGKALEFIESLEKGIPFEDLAENYTLEQKYGEIKVRDLEDNEELQESIYSDLLTMKGFSEAKIKKMVAMAKENDELLTESRDGLDEITKAITEERKEIVRQAEENRIVREKQALATKETISKTVMGIKQIVPGIELNDTEKKELLKMMTVPVKYIQKDNKNIPVSAVMDLRMKDPISFEMKLNYFIKNGFFDSDAKFDLLLKKTESKATAKLIEKMNGERKRDGQDTIKNERQQEKEKTFLFPQNIRI